MLNYQPKDPAVRDILKKLTASLSVEQRLQERAMASRLAFLLPDADRRRVHAFMRQRMMTNEAQALRQIIGLGLNVIDETNEFWADQRLPTVLNEVGAQ